MSRVLKYKYHQEAEINKACVAAFALLRCCFLNQGFLRAYLRSTRTGVKSSKVFTFLIILSFLSGCEETIDKPYGTGPSIRLVADAMLTNQPGESYVKLSLPLAGPNDKPVKVTDAIITLNDDKNSLRFREDSTETGSYLPISNLRGVTGKTYRLFIKAGDFIDSATTYLVPVSPLEEFKTYPDNSKPGYFFIGVENGGDPAILQYIVDPPGCTGADECRIIQYNYILSSFDVPQIFSPKKESLSFPAGSRVIRKKYSLNPGYESYIRAIVSETEWHGGLFDVEPGNPKGNFGKYTLGYFSGCSLIIDTVSIQ